MSKSDALNLVLSASAILCFCGWALNYNESRYSTTQATVQPPYADQNISLTSASRLILPDQASYQHANDLVPDRSDTLYPVQSAFSQRLHGGILLRFEFGLIVVSPAVAPESLQPTALTTDAIITSSVRSKMAGQSQLSPGDFAIQTDDGVVTIHAKGESLDQAIEVINLALGVPDVRQIVYTMPSNVWKTAETGVGSRSTGVQEFRSSGASGIGVLTLFISTPVEKKRA
jgi:hypothetical protein